MTAEAWARITDRLNAILEEPETEAKVLTAEPPEIRAEVSRLLAAHRKAAQDSTEDEKQGRTRVLANRYELIELLGAGGSGAAWLSLDRDSGQRVVVKLPLHWEWFRQDLARRFHSEAGILRGLQHPGIVAILHSGDTEEGTPFLVMPYIEGHSLRQLLDERPMPREQAAAIVEQVGEAIQFAHRSNVIHRDIKPENIMLRREPDGTIRAVLIDFGISLFSDLKEESGTTTRFFGTTRYMAPEQLLGKPAFGSDVYALALIAYEMWTGGPLLKGETPVALYEEQRQLSESRLARGNTIPQSLGAAIWEGLQPNPDRRPAADLFARKVARAMRRPSRFRLPSRRTVLAGAAVAIPGAAWLAYQNRPLTAAETRVNYKAGQTYESVGFKKAAQVDLDVTVFTEDGTHLLGNKLVSESQGAYYNPLTPRARRQGLKRRWRLTGDIMPIHGYSAICANFREAGVRFPVMFEITDAGASSVVVDLIPAPKRKAVPFRFERNRMYRLALDFEPALQAVRVSVDGAVVFERYEGTREFLEVPGVVVGFGVSKSKRGEAVFGDLTYVMD